jgi:hypothetical protein
VGDEDDFATGARDGLFAIGKGMVGFDGTDARKVEGGRSPLQHAAEVLGVHSGDRTTPVSALAERIDERAILDKEARYRRTVVRLPAIGEESEELFNSFSVSFPQPA